jgi:glycosyltransferase involved in cell wall biosynthesis
MRVGLLIYGDLNLVSGGYIYDRKLVKSLEASGDNVEIVSLPWRNYSQHLADNFSQSFARKLKSLELDVLIQDELNHPSLFQVNRQLRARASFPIVSLVHHLRISEQHPGVLMPLYRWVEKRYLQSVDGFIFNSQTTKLAVEKLIGPGKPAVVANPAGDRLGIDISSSKIQTRAFAVGPLQLVFVGSVIPRKGLHTVLDALAGLNPDTWRLTVTGSLESDPAYARQLKARVAERGWQSHVTFAGNLEDKELRKILLESHALVMPSQYEGFGIAYLEGMSAGLPAIGSTTGAAHEIIREGKTGFLLNPGDIGALTGQLRKWSVDRVLLAEMSVAAREAYEVFPGWDASMKLVRNFLMRIVE